MFKVFIADDEIYVLSLIERLVDWESMGLAIVGTADNGLTAFEDIQRLRPDIVIVDVRMPGIDGISLMQKVRSLDERVRFIIISGHKRFEYAKSAMKYNVEDYLLKPIHKDELVSILQNITERLTRERAAQLAQRDNDHRLSERDDSLGRLFLEHLLSEGGFEGEHPLEQTAEKYCLPLRPGAFRFVIVHLNSREKELDPSFVETIMALLDRRLIEEMRPVCHAVASLIRGRAVTALMNYEGEDEDRFQAGLVGYLGQIRAVLGKFESLSINLCLGEREAAFEKIGRSLEGARRAQMARLALGGDKIIDSRMAPAGGAGVCEVFPERHRAALEAAIQSLDEQRIQAQVLDAFARADPLGRQDPCVFWETAEVIMRAFERYLEQVDLPGGSDWRARADECLTPGDMAAMIAAQVGALLRRCLNEGQPGEHPAIRVAKRYIAEHYAGNLSLAAVAKVVNISPIYLSMMFKREVNVNFLEYLSKLRIEKSKQLLRDVRMNVQEVAASVGFSDARYYAKTFRKIVGVTPSEYRNHHAQ